MYTDSISFLKAETKYQETTLQKTLHGKGVTLFYSKSEF